MREFICWNPEYLKHVHGEHFNSLEEVQALQGRVAKKVMTTIEVVDDAHLQTLIAVAEEGDLRYVVVKQQVRLAAYRGVDYMTPQRAAEDGALYTLIARFDADKMEDIDTMRMINDVACRTSSCVNADMSQIELVWLKLDAVEVVAHMRDLV